MRHFVTMAAAGLLLAGCAQMNPPPPVAAPMPMPMPSALGDQNRFVAPAGFEAAAAAARESQMRNPPPGTTGFGPAGFVPMDDDFDPLPAGIAPVGPGTPGGPNIVDYALSTSHPIGTPIYDRWNPFRWRNFERNCLQFPSQNAAQEAFLAAGGPVQDRQNLDPDGDGYACWWNPEPFRRAMLAGG